MPLYRPYMLGGVLRHAKIYAIRHMANPPTPSMGQERTDGEKRLEALLRQRFLEDKEAHIHAEDISSGCGSMFNVKVESALFKGLSKVEQHKMVTEALKAEIKAMHGIVIETRVSIKQ